MSYYRSKMINGNGPYWYEVKSERHGKKVVQKHIRYIGKTRPSGKPPGRPGVMPKEPTPQRKTGTGTAYYYNPSYEMDQYKKKDGAWYRKSDAGWVEIPKDSDTISTLEKGRDPITGRALDKRSKPTVEKDDSGLTKAEKKAGYEFYRKQSQKRRDRDLELIREQQEAAYKQKNTAALNRLNDRENIIIEVNIEKAEEREIVMPKESTAQRNKEEAPQRKTGTIRKEIAELEEKRATFTDAEDSGIRARYTAMIREKKAELKKVCNHPEYTEEIRKGSAFQDYTTKEWVRETTVIHHCSVCGKAAIKDQKKIPYKG